MKSTQTAWADSKLWGRREKVISRFNMGYISRQFRKNYARTQKWVVRRRTIHPTKTRIPVFVLGSNRSGTQMVNSSIGNSPHGWDYPEREFSLAFDRYYLRSSQVIKRLIHQSPAPIVTFGSILNSQFAKELLATHENAKVVWVYRRYQDAVNSSVHRFGGHQKDLARFVANGELERLGARGKNLSNHTVGLISKLFHEDISSEEGACLYWYMRNQLYFDLNLDNNPRVYIIQYESAVQNSEKEFLKLFRYLGFPYDPAIIDGIFASSIGKHPWPGVESSFQEVCDRLQTKLDQQFYGFEDEFIFDNVVSQFSNAVKN